MKLSETQNRNETLKAVAERLKNEIDECTSTRDLPALVKQLREVMDELEQDAAPEQYESMLDRIKRERANA